MRLCAPIGTKHELYNSNAFLFVCGSWGRGLSVRGTCDSNGLQANFFTKPVPVGGRKSKIYTIYKIIVLDNNWE